MKENTASDILRVIFTVILVPVLFLLTAAAILEMTALNPVYWKKTIFGKEGREFIVDSFMEEGPTDYGLIEELELDDNYTEDMFSDFMDIMIDEAFEVVIDEDTEVDRDRFDDFLDKYDYDEILEDKGMSRSEISDRKDEIYDLFNEQLEELHDDLNEDGTLKELNRISEKLNRTVICTAIIAVILMVPLMIIHKNKWRPVRNFGIALWVSQLGTCLIWLLLFIATAAAYEEKFVERSSESDAVIGHLVKNMVGGITLFYFALLILGFVIMGVAIKMIGITNDKIIDSEDGAGSYDNEDGMGYSDHNDPFFSPVNME